MHRIKLNIEYFCIRMSNNSGLKLEHLFLCRALHLLGQFSHSAICHVDEMLGNAIPLHIK